jgi:uncharacterized membrane protein YjjP (DUF1212 family)
MEKEFGILADQRPKVTLVGADGNIFNLMGIAARALRKAGVGKEKIDEMLERVASASSYDEALVVLMDYVEAH